MKLIGVGLIFIGAYLAARRNGERERERLSLLLGYESFLREMRSRTASLLEPVSRWVGGFRCEALERVGFLPAVREGRRLGEAFSRASSGLDSRASEALLELFSRVGASLDEEVARLDAALSVLETRVSAEKLASEERTRTFTVLALAAAAGVGILVL